MKKILALNFGRPKQTCDMFLNNAVESARAAGAEVEVIQMMTKKIGRCRGCGACSGGFKAGKFNTPVCIFKDDFQEILEKWLDADGVIIASPVYVLAPCGQFFDFFHRLGPACDRAVATHRDQQRKAAGQPDIDQRLLKQRYAVFISVGGCPWHHWVSYGLPAMHVGAFSQTIKVVAGVDIHAYYKSPERKEMFAVQCTEAGKALVESIGVDPAQVAYLGDPGYCPTCHGRTFTVIPGTTKLECPVCGITGDLSIVGDEVKIAFTQEAIEHSRMLFGGIEDHYIELHSDEL